MGPQDPATRCPETRETHVLMNNCYRDFAVRNASELGDLLQRPVIACMLSACRRLACC